MKTETKNKKETKKWMGVRAMAKGMFTFTILLAISFGFLGLGVQEAGAIPSSIDTSGTVGLRENATMPIKTTGSGDPR